MASGYPDWHKGVKSDIIAQTIDLIKTSIDAVTVDKFDVDIVAQTIAQLGIDIKAQTIAELIQFVKVGKCYADFGGWLADPNEEIVVVDVSGRGNLIFYLVYLDAASGSDESRWDIVLDGSSLVDYRAIYWFNDLGCDVNTFPVKLFKYAADGVCCIAFVPSVPITFDSSLTLKIKASAVGSQSGYYWYIYTLL